MAKDLRLDLVQGIGCLSSCRALCHWLSSRPKAEMVLDHELLGQPARQGADPPPEALLNEAVPVAATSVS